MGPTSIYRLTVPEMARLRRGFEVLQEDREEKSEERMANSDAATSDMRRQASNPHRAARGRVRSGDKAALTDFAESNNLHAS